MKSFSPLYLVICLDESQMVPALTGLATGDLPSDQAIPSSMTSILQMRTEVEPLTNIQSRHNAQGETILILPPPVIEIARGHQDDLYGLAAKMFGARWGAWTYHGDYVHSYQLQNGQGAVPPGLTLRERSIMNALEAKPGQTVDDLFLFLRRLPESEKGQIASAVRFLYENGFIVMDKPGMQVAYDEITRYTVRRTG